ncbi:MAG: RNA-binding S4 domain-containing protein [Lysobacterales bacterium]
MSTQEITLTHQPVELFKILKLSGATGSGGEAKMVIAEGLVSVNGEVETRKRRKIRHGDEISIEQETLQVVCHIPETPRAARKKMESPQ